MAQVLKEEVKNRILEAATRPSCSYGIVWSVLGKMDRAANTTRCHQRNHQPGIIAEDYCLSIVETVTAAPCNITRKFALVTVFAKSSLVNGTAVFW